jgi:hypothetical protein
MLYENIGQWLVASGENDSPKSGVARAVTSGEE